VALHLHYANHVARAAQQLNMTTGGATSGVDSDDATSEVDSSGAASANAVPGCTSSTSAMTAGGATLRVDSGGATSGADSGGAVSTDVDSAADAASGADSGGAVSARCWTRYGSAMCAVCARGAVLRFCRRVWICRKCVRSVGSVFWPL